MEIRKRYIETATIKGDYWVIVNDQDQRLTKIFGTKREAKSIMRDLELGIWTDIMIEEEWV